MPRARRIGKSFWRPAPDRRTAADHLAEARVHERDGRVPDATASFELAIARGEQDTDLATAAEALRRASVLYHHQNDPERARQYCLRSYRLALELPDRIRAAEALNTLGGIEFERGAMEEARELLAAALELGGARVDLRSRIEQNLGIIATIQGNHDAALAHYTSSLEAFARRSGRQGLRHRLPQPGDDQCRSAGMGRGGALLR